MHWQPGPITVFDAGEYAGDARIADIAPDAERLLSYALDLDVEIAPKSLDPERRLVSIIIQKGGLTKKEIETREHRYTIKNSGDTAVKLLFERPVDENWPEVDPAPAEKTRDQYRVAITSAAGASETFVITERRPIEMLQALKSLDFNDLSLLVQTKGTSPAIDAALKELITLKTDLLKRQAEQRVIEQVRTDTTIEQQRLRDNLKAVSTTDTIRERFLKRLNETEDQLLKLNKDVADAVSRVKEASQRLEERLATLVVE